MAFAFLSAATLAAVFRQLAGRVTPLRPIGPGGGEIPRRACLRARSKEGRRPGDPQRGAAEGRGRRAAAAVAWAASPVSRDGALLGQ
jgi:hypothetical protein